MIIKPTYYVLCVVLIVALLVSWFVIGAEKDKIIAVSINGGILLFIIARMVQIKLKKVKRLESGLPGIPGKPTTSTKTGSGGTRIGW